MGYQNMPGEKRDFVISPIDLFHKLLITELSRAHGLDVKSKDETNKVYVYCCQEDFDSLMQAIHPAQRLLCSRLFEAVAETIESVGETPSAFLDNIIKLTYVDSNGQAIPECFTKQSSDWQSTRRAQRLTPENPLNHRFGRRLL